MADKVDVDMKVTMTSNVQTVTGSIENRNIPDFPDNVVMHAVAGTSWSMALYPGKYVFVCSVSGQPGDIGPATVIVHAPGGDKTFGPLPDTIDKGAKTGDIQINFEV